MSTRRSVPCHEDLGVVLRAFAGVSDEPIPACRDRSRLSVSRVEVVDPASLPAHPLCEDCGRALPSPDTGPAVVCASDRRRGIVASCSACPIKNGRSTLCTVTADEAGTRPPEWE